jgi:hypothetical protein
MLLVYYWVLGLPDDSETFIRGPSISYTVGKPNRRSRWSMRPVDYHTFPTLFRVSCLPLDRVFGAPPPQPRFGFVYISFSN